MAKHDPRREATTAVKVWLAANRKNQRWLADRIRVSEGLLSNVLSGRRAPSDDVRKAVRRVTGVDLAAPAREVA